MIGELNLPLLSATAVPSFVGPTAAAPAIDFPSLIAVPVALEEEPAGDLPVVEEPVIEVVAKDVAAPVAIAASPLPATTAPQTEPKIAASQPAEADPQAETVLSHPSRPASRAAIDAPRGSDAATVEPGAPMARPDDDSKPPLLPVTAPPVAPAPVRDAATPTMPRQDIVPPQPSPVPPIDLDVTASWQGRMASEIVDRFGARDGGDTVRFQLRPAHLGSITVELLRTDVGDRVQFSADTEQAQQLIAAHRTGLEQELRQAGSKPAQVEIASGSTPSDPHAQRDEKPRSPAPSGAGTHRVAPHDTPTDLPPAAEQHTRARYA